MTAHALRREAQDGSRTRIGLLSSVACAASVPADLTGWRAAHAAVKRREDPLACLSTLRAGRARKAEAEPAPVTAAASLPRALERAIAIQEMLGDGATILAAADQAEEVNVFAIGHMLHHIASKDLFAAPSLTVRQAMERIAKEEMRRPDAPLPSRHRMIAALKRTGCIPGDLHDKVFKPSGTVPSVRSIGLVLAEQEKVPFDEIISTSRCRSIVKARFRAIWVMRAVCGHSLTAIGGHFGNRDHTTVLNAINKVNLEVSGDAGVRASMDAVCEKADTLGVMANLAMLRNTRMVSVTRG